jgi:hypothetical protein
MGLLLDVAICASNAPQTTPRSDGVFHGKVPEQLGREAIHRGV